ncbi:uncharacterized protein BXZ73DRAFT_103371 [Epithele typhae]|uniref:uncharacterized protein n=1 Tax=Epithele typhae TaxID=378194 RepID=UPI0020086AE4|nr:uncharacterized protein BXZ73DRAFT_103371 [Epithele typhae]KAH9924995.1 hypothetical protein BXZ73DRAFT_103371 [Epithele typhae]
MNHEIPDTEQLKKPLMIKRPRPEKHALIEEFFVVQVQLYIQTAVAVMIVYEYLITLPSEIFLYWPSLRKATGAVSLFMINRYLSLGYYVYDLWFTFNTPTTKIVSTALPVCIRNFAHDFKPQEALVTAYFQAILSICIYLPWAAFAGLRIYAISRNLIVSILIFLLSAAPFAINMAFNIPTLFAEQLGPDYWATGASSILTALPCRLGIVSRGALIVADVLTVAATWYNLWHTRSLIAREEREAQTLSSILLRDGTIYFITLVLLNSLHLALTLASVGTSLAGRASFINSFTEPITTVLISRFLLNLQAANKRIVGETSTATSDGRAAAAPAGTLVFQRVVGSMGASLDFGIGTAGGGGGDFDFEFGLESESEGHELHSVGRGEHKDGGGGYGGGDVERAEEASKV